MNLFYHPDIKQGSVVEFDSQESIHLSKVLRKQSGDVIDITNGKGIHAKAVLEVSKKSVSAIVENTKDISARKQFLELAIAPTKNNERTEWFVEKAVELGIEKISLIQCNHSERVHLKTDRLHKVAISAMKQSLRFYLPEITPLLPFQEWLKQSREGVKCIAHCETDPMKILLQNAIKKELRATIAIGPEGDFDRNEIDLAAKSGFISVSLGESRLRTETAALAAVHTFELMQQQ